MEQGVLGSSLTATSRRGFLFSGRLGASWLDRTLFSPYGMLILKCTRVLLHVVQ